MRTADDAAKADDTAEAPAPRQGRRRRVDIVPHTHWDRECSGATATRPDTLGSLASGYAYERTFAIVSAQVRRG